MEILKKPPEKVCSHLFSRYLVVMSWNAWFFRQTAVPMYIRQQTTRGTSRLGRDVTIPAWWVLAADMTQPYLWSTSSSLARRGPCLWRFSRSSFWV
jgi:hypothetical protein